MEKEDKLDFKSPIVIPSDKEYNYFAIDEMIFRQFGIRLSHKDWFTLALRNTVSQVETVTLFDNNLFTGTQYTYSFLTTAFTGNLANIDIILNGQLTFIPGYSDAFCTISDLLNFLNFLNVGTFVHSTIGANEIFYVTVNPGNVLGLLRMTDLGIGHFYNSTPTIQQNILATTNVEIITSSGTYNRINNDVNTEAYSIFKIILSSASQTTPFNQIFTITFADANGHTEIHLEPAINSTDAYQSQIGLITLDIEKEKLVLSGNTTLAFNMDPFTSMKMLFFFVRNRKGDALGRKLTEITSE